MTDGRQRTFDALMGRNFDDGKGNLTVFLSYRHADPVPSSNRDYGGCQLEPTNDPKTGFVTGITCGGSSNSNFFRPTSVANPNSLTQYSVFGTSLVPRGSVSTSPPADFNSQPYIYLTREDDRYNAAFMAHEAINDAFQPYSEFFFMDDKTHQQIAPAAVFAVQSADPVPTITTSIATILY